MAVRPCGPATSPSRWPRVIAWDPSGVPSFPAPCKSAGESPSPGLASLVLTTSVLAEMDLVIDVVGDDVVPVGEALVELLDVLFAFFQLLFVLVLFAFVFPLDGGPFFVLGLFLFGGVFFFGLLVDALGCGVGLLGSVLASASAAVFSCRLFFSGFVLVVGFRFVVGRLRRRRRPAGVRAWAWESGRDRTGP